VLVDEAGDDVAVGRSHAEAPEIDGVVVIEDGAGLAEGELVRVRVTDADEHDLFGSLVV